MFIILFKQYLLFFTFQVGWNGAHNSFPHVTLLAPFSCDDARVASLARRITQAGTPLASSLHSLALEKYVSPNFLAFFVGEPALSVVRRLSADLRSLLAAEFGIAAEAPSRTDSFHLTLAYQFAPEHLEGLEDLAASIDPSSDGDGVQDCPWHLRLYSFEDRGSTASAGLEDTSDNVVHTYRVVRPHSPHGDEELEVVVGDYVYISQPELNQSSSPWIAGRSWLTGCRGLLPKACLVQTAETDTWTLHSPLSGHQVTSSSTLSMQKSLERLKLTSTVPKWSGEDSMRSRTSSTVSGGGRSSAGGGGRRSGGGGQGPVRRRQVFVARHGERVDFTFGANWIPVCFDETGAYDCGKDLNLPPVLPKRSPGGFLFDSPLTRVGRFQARLLGQKLGSEGVTFRHAYASPALRCVETCHEILIGLGLQDELKINLEPGLFEWLAWHQKNMPTWMSPQDLKEAG